MEKMDYLALYSKIHMPKRSSSCQKTFHRNWIKKTFTIVFECHMLEAISKFKKTWQKKIQFLFMIVFLLQKKMLQKQFFIYNCNWFFFVLPKRTQSMSFKECFILKEKREREHTFCILLLKFWIKNRGKGDIVLRIEYEQNTVLNKNDYIRQGQF